MTTDEIDTSVVVIGGGQAGLSVSYYLKRLGLDPGNEFVVLDRGPGTGGAWQFRWEALRIGSAHRINDLPGLDALGLSFETADRKAPAKEVVADYYRQYEEFYGFQVVRPASVTSVENFGASLLVTFNNGQFEQQVTTEIVINATGTWGSPFIPWYPGLKDFAGKHVHTTEYKNAAEYEGKKVVVVGGGTSAIGFLLELESMAENLVWVSRRPIDFLDEGELNLEARKSAVQLQDDAARAGRALPSIVSGTGVPRTRRIQAGIARGLLKPRPMFASIEPGGVRWENGDFEEADVILWSTGFRPELRHLAPLRLREKEGGIVVANGTAFKDGRIFFAGYGPQASTIGANRAGRTIARQAIATLSRLKREVREQQDALDASAHLAPAAPFERPQADVPAVSAPVHTVPPEHSRFAPPPAAAQPVAAAVPAALPFDDDRPLDIPATQLDYFGDGDPRDAVVFVPPADGDADVAAAQPAEPEVEAGGDASGDSDELSEEFVSAADERDLWFGAEAAADADEVHADEAAESDESDEADDEADADTHDEADADTQDEDDDPEDDDLDDDDDLDSAGFDPDDIDEVAEELDDAAEDAVADELEADDAEGSEMDEVEASEEGEFESPAGESAIPAHDTPEGVAYDVDEGELDPDVAEVADSFEAGDAETSESLDDAVTFDDEPQSDTSSIDADVTEVADGFEASGEAEAPVDPSTQTGELDADVAAVADDFEAGDDEASENEPAGEQASEDDDDEDDDWMRPQ